ncbi:MAG: hypothetical protein QM733_11150 [Ilumatobacteraceae bacterium]
MRLDEPPRALPEAFVEVLEFGELFEHADPSPPVDLGPVWRAMHQRLADLRAEIDSPET